MKKKMDIEGLRQSMLDAARTLKRTRKQIVEGLAAEIRAMRDAGYSVSDVADFIRKESGVEIRPTTISTYLSKMEKN